MTDKPSYLGLLNAISNAEGEAECYLDAWAAATCRDDVRAVIATVALREGEHAKAFAKRVCELGFAVQRREDGKGAARLAIAGSTTLSDLEKFQQLDVGSPAADGKPDIFAGMFGDSTIDIQTGALLGRYIAEERDSGRMLAGCRAALEAECAAAGNSSTNGSAKGHSNGSESLESRLARVERLLEQVVDKLGAAV